MPTKARKRPCEACPYLLDAPSGLWAEEEYAKLPLFDGEIADQAVAGAMSGFACHASPSQLCAGWLGCHGPDNLLAVRVGVSSGRYDPSVLDYQTRVPLHPSGQAACDHGLRDIDAPSDATLAAMAKVLVIRPDIELR